MNFLLVYPSPGILGGIETLMGRMSRWLLNQGHQVTILTTSDQNWKDVVPKEVRCLALGEKFGGLKYHFHTGRILKELGVPAPDVIKSFNIKSAWVACQIATRINNGCKVIAGIYNPNVFTSECPPSSLAFWRIDGLYLRNFLRCIPANARLFCDVSQIEELEATHQQAGLLWPLPIDTRHFAPATRNAKWGKIVSVGRLSPMKEYNLYMIDVVKELIHRGHKVTWSVYGEGPYESEMRQRIQQEGLEAVITLEGTVPYERFWQVLQDACVFVGMGTSILEASLFGVPNVVACGYDRQGVTYGPVHRLPSGSIGQLSVFPPRLKVVDEIERILRFNSAEYGAEQEAVCRHVQVHTMEQSMARFLELVRQADPVKPREPSLYLSNYPLHLVDRAFRHP
jgi:glycosyltransferase involved in cell wall biosynthesis